VTNNANETYKFKAGIHVISNAKNNRLAADVPMIVPLVNASHLDIIEQQLACRGKGRGFIVTNCNCSTAGLVVPLKALDDAFGVEKVFVVTMQAISGAGYPGRISSAQFNYFKY